MTKDDMDIVSAFRQRLADKVKKERFELWFGGRTSFEANGHRLTVGAPNEFLRDFLRTQFCSAIVSACHETFGPAYSVEFSVVSGSPDGAGQGNSTKGTPERTPASAEPPVRPARSAASGSEAAERQKPLEKLSWTKEKARRDAAIDFGSIIKGDGNGLALAAARLATEEPGAFSPLLIHGPTSVGKTHLLQAICNEARKNHRGLVAVYLSAEQFTTEFLQALRGGGLPSFRARYRGLDLLAVDDLHFFIRKSATLVELLYTVDTLARRGRQVVFASDRAPAELRPLGGDLISRLESGMVCRIEPPDYETRLGILGRMADRMGLRLSPEVGHFIASRLNTHARELSGALCRLHAESRATGRPISLGMAEQALAEMIRDGNRVVRLADIEKAVCETFGLEPESLQSDRKAKVVSHPRMLAMWLARKYTRSALSEIGQYFGRRSHSTVVSAQKRVDRWIADNATLDLAEHSRPVSDAIAQLERQIRIG